MKNSDKILAISILIILVFITGLIIASRFMVTGISDRASYYSDTEIISRNLACGDFDKIETDGTWQLEIYRGDDYSVSVEFPQSAANAIDVQVWDGCLRFENDVRWTSQRSPFRAVVTMPNLKGLRTKEGASILVGDFSCDDLDVHVTGAAKIDAENLQITNLSLRCDGAADANFKESEVFNAKIDVNGASRIVLNMTGGELSGSAHGAASIVYYGEVAIQDIATAGAVSVRQR